MRFTPVKNDADRSFRAQPAQLVADRAQCMERQVGWKRLRTLISVRHFCQLPRHCLCVLPVRHELRPGERENDPLLSFLPR